MSETLATTQKRKAEDSMPDEAPKSKAQLCAYHNENDSYWQPMARNMSNHDLIKLGISQDREGKSCIKPTIVEGILNIIQARPDHWHRDWVCAETQIQQLLNSAIGKDEHVYVKDLYWMLSAAQARAESDQYFVEAICGKTFWKSPSSRWDSVMYSVNQLGRVLHRIVGLSYILNDSDSSDHELATAVLDLARLDKFHLGSRSYGKIEPKTSDVDFVQGDATFRALQTQMIRVLLHIKDNHEYQSIMKEIITALEDGEARRL